jgi:hypothetical protein
MAFDAIMEQLMRKCTLLIAGMFLFGLAGISHAANATNVTFSFGGFSDGATASVSFTGTDINNDGVFSNVPSVGTYPEIADLVVSFSGNTITPAFSVNLTNQYVIYVNTVGLTPTADGLPVATAGDGVIDVGGNVMNGLTDLGSFSLIGGACSAFDGKRVILLPGQCADLAYTPIATGVTVHDTVLLPVPEPMGWSVFVIALSALGLAYGYPRRTLRAGKIG